MSSSGPVGLQEARAQRWLVTFVGLQPEEVTYSLDEREARAGHAGLALISLLAPGTPPAHVVVLATPESEKQTWPAVASGLERIGLAGTLCVIEDPTDLDDFLRALVGAIPPDRDLEIVVDLTHGFRHFPLLAYAGLLYLAALRPRVSVAGCFFGLRDARGETARFLNLLPLVALPEWLHALRLLDQRADATYLVELLASGRADEQLLRCTEDFARALLWRCPLDAVEPAEKLVGFGKPLRRALRDAALPGTEELATHLLGAIESYGIAGTTRPAGRGAKPSISRETLALHARHVAAAFARHDLPAASGLLREWIVSWAWTLASQSGEGDGLERTTRARLSSRLGALAALEDDPDLRDLLDADQRRLAWLWRSLSEVRNALMHNGMRRQPVLDLDAKGAQLEREWRWLQQMSSAPAGVGSISLEPSGRRGTLLVTPLGRSPDVLGAALDRSEPRAERLLVVTSRECAAGVEAQVAGRLDPDAVDVLFLEDPTGGVDELDGLVRRAAPLLAKARTAQVNLTGGTTLLGLAVERIARRAERLELPVRRFVLLQRDGDGGASSVVWVDGQESDRRPSEAGRS